MDKPLAIVAAGALALAACSGETDRTTPPAPDGAAGTAPAAGGSDEARAYVARFATQDVDACFTDVALADVDLTPRPGELARPARPPLRVIVLVDGSGSMAARLGARTKLELARDATRAFVDGLPPEVEASLMVFGQQGDNSAAGKPRSCGAVDTLVPMGRDRAGLDAAVGRIAAVGWTPLAAGLQRAERALAADARPGDQLIYVVSDGEETCGGDPVAAARRINQGSTRAVVNIIGFGVPSQESPALQAVAAAGGGSFVNVASDAAAQRTLAAVREANRAATNAVRTAAAGSRNAVRTAAAQTRAATCVSALIRRETAGMTADIARRTRGGEAVPFADEARRLLDQRHRDLRDRERAFATRLGGDEAAAKDRIDRAAEEAR